MTNLMVTLKKATYVYLIAGKSLKQHLHWNQITNLKISSSIPFNIFFD